MIGRGVNPGRMELAKKESAEAGVLESGWLLKTKTAFNSVR